MNLAIQCRVSAGAVLVRCRCRCRCAQWGLCIRPRTLPNGSMMEAVVNPPPRSVVGACICAPRAGSERGCRYTC